MILRNLSLALSALVLTVNIAHAGNDDYFVTQCNQVGGQIYQNLYISSIYADQTGFGFTYSSEASSDKKNTVMHHLNKAKNNNGNDNEMFFLINNAYEHQLAVDACLDQSDDMLAVEQSEEQ